jgi:hypothetical protein
LSDNPRGNAPAGLRRAWASLERQGYALTNDRKIGLPASFRDEFLRSYFNNDVMRHDDGDFPVDRKRARDVIRYYWRGEDLELREHETITITNRADIPGKRDHTRVMLLENAQAEELICRFLELVPPGRRQTDGTFGVNLFRTYTDVVTKPHHDNEQFIMLYVLDRIGDGAESYLYRPRDVTKEGVTIRGPVFKEQLNPGEIMIFEDELFKHGATPLQAPPDEIARRDVLICTVDNRRTYLAPGAA